MSPILASLVTVGFLIWVFRRDFREKPNLTNEIWLPTLWLFLVSSKPVSQWLHIFGLPSLSATSDEEGSTLDAMVFLGLILYGMYVLNKRRISVGEIARNNMALTVFIVYCLASVVWSDFAFISFKRWIKILGHPIMVLILFTEPEPKEAIIRMVKRCAYVILPVSILWMKYYPNLGRKFTPWGQALNVGITGGKNQLGEITSTLGLFFVWRLFQVWRTEKGTARKKELRLTLILGLMTAYCLYYAHSATSDMCLMLGVGTMVVLALRSVNKKVIGAYVVAGILTLVILQLVFDIYGHIVDISGHEANIIGRAVLWKDLFRVDTSPIFGVGFESFWLGPRMALMHEGRPWQPNEAHNGYIEIYLTLGIVGIFLLGAMIVATFRKIRLDLINRFEWGRFEMGCLVGILAHSWTEAGFRGLSFPFFIFFLIAVKYPHLQWDSSPAAVRTEVLEPEPELVYSHGKSW